MSKDELQVENGNYTRIVNPLIEALVKAPITNTELRIVLSVIRKTYGYQKTEDEISLSQFVEMTGSSRRNIIYALQNLEAKRILIIKRESLNTNKIKVNKYFDTWLVQTVAPQVKKNRARAVISWSKVVQTIALVQKSAQTSAKGRKKLVQPFAHTKEITKETKEITPEQSSDAKEINEIILSFKEINPSYAKWYARPPQRDAVRRLLSQHGKEKILGVLGVLPKTNTMLYIPHASTPIQLEEKWQDIKDALLKKKLELQDKKPKIFI